MGVADGDSGSAAHGRSVSLDLGIVATAGAAAAWAPVRIDLPAGGVAAAAAATVGHHGGWLQTDQQEGGGTSGGPPPAAATATAAVPTALAAAASAAANPAAAVISAAASAASARAVEAAGVAADAAAPGTSDDERPTAAAAAVAGGGGAVGAVNEKKAGLLWMEGGRGGEHLRGLPLPIAVAGAPPTPPSRPASYVSGCNLSLASLPCGAGSGEEVGSGGCGEEGGDGDGGRGGGGGAPVGHGLEPFADGDTLSADLEDLFDGASVASARYAELPAHVDSALSTDFGEPYVPRGGTGGGGVGGRGAAGSGRGGDDDGGGDGGRGGVGGGDGDGDGGGSDASPMHLDAHGLVWVGNEAETNAAWALAGAGSLLIEGGDSRGVGSGVGDSCTLACGNRCDWVATGGGVGRRGGGGGGGGDCAGGGGGGVCGCCGDSGLGAGCGACDGGSGGGCGVAGCDGAGGSGHDGCGGDFAVGADVEGAWVGAAEAHNALVAGWTHEAAAAGLVRAHPRRRLHGRPVTGDHRGDPDGRNDDNDVDVDFDADGGDGGDGGGWVHDGAARYLPPTARPPRAPPDEEADSDGAADGSHSVATDGGLWAAPTTAAEDIRLVPMGGGWGEGGGGGGGGRPSAARTVPTGGGRGCGP
ncbi:hypothetical protein MMPV_007868 [Pyropia vietnamensis]